MGQRTPFAVEAIVFGVKVVFVIVIKIVRFVFFFELCKVYELFCCVHSLDHHLDLARPGERDRSFGHLATQQEKVFYLSKGRSFS